MEYALVLPLSVTITALLFLDWGILKNYCAMDINVES